MTVTGTTTAQVAATSYVPPFKYVTSYGPAPQVTGIIAGNVTATVSGGAVPTTTTTPSTGVVGTNDAFAYLQAHMMSSPSYRYTYLLWIALALIALIYAAAHHMRLPRLSPGAGYARWGMRRITIGSNKPGARNSALPSNSVLVAIFIITIVTFVLSVIGSDYIAPSSSVFGFRKRDTNPTYTINKAFWTSGSRIGDMAFALMPLVVLVALKSPPVAFLSFRVFTHLWSDKLAWLHRASAWLVWVLTTVHIVLWTIQLFKDQIKGKAAWIAMWTNYRFIFGAVAYGALTAVMVLSMRPIRKNRYEFFYIAHVVFVCLTLLCSAIHHPPLWYWMAAAAGLWGAERAFRFARFTRINALFGKRQHEPIVAGRPYRDTPATPEDAYGMRGLKGTHGLPYAPYTDKTLPRSPGDETPWTPATDAPKNEFGARSEIAYYDESSLQPLGSYDARQIDPYSRDNASRPSTSTLVSKDGGYFPVLEKERPLSHSGHTYGKESIATVTAPSRGPSLSPPIPIGFAQAQLLPSSTIRLTIRVAHPFKWAPGQNVLLYLPDLSRIQSHPFTIINNTGPEIVLLVKARKGVTRRLFDLVRTRSLAAVGLNGATDKRLSLASMRGGEGCVQVPPVYVRTWIDGPFGSSSRSRWGEFSSVLIICGGSGISFGASICDHICRTMVQGQAGKRFQVQRVRLCWVVREYAEIAWVAGQLRRCQEMVTAAQLQIDIFVTNASKVRDDFAPPRPGFAGGGHDRRGSTDSVTSEISQDFAIDDNESIDTRDSSAHYADIIDLTNYEDEEDVNDPVEHRLSDRLQHQGKVRRANSRKAGRRTAKQASKTSSYPPHRQQHSILSPYEDASGAEMAARGSNYDARSPEETPFAPPHPILSGNDSRRHSYRSVAESAYGRYDPFSGGQAGQYGPSPSPSLMFDDNQSVAGESVHNLLSRASRAGSMVLLEDNSGDPTGDAALWVEQSDYSAMSVLSEMARPGKPKLSSVLEEEIQQARGSMMVATCGPATLNTVVRNLVSRNISPGKILHGDRRGHISIYSEDYET